jgi:ABC-type proline/glycine betaine transport system substrate-binding protein
MTMKRQSAHPTKDIMKNSSKLIATLAATAALTLGLGGCASSDSDSPAGAADASLGTIRVGALATPAGDILKFVQDNLAEDAGLTIEFVEFTDYNTPNTALAGGEIDANLFQNTTFLGTYNDLPAQRSLLQRQGLRPGRSERWRVDRHPQRPNQRRSGAEASRCGGPHRNHRRADNACGYHKQPA